MEKAKRIVCWTMSAAAIIAVILSVFLFYQPFDRKCQLTAVNISAPVGQTIGYREALSLETRKSLETVLTPEETYHIYFVR